MTRLNRLNWTKVLICYSLTFMHLACDKDRKNKCEWYLLPNPDADPLTPPGSVSLCVGNFKLKRQRCYFSGSPELVEQFNGVAFRYNDLKYKSGIPKAITHISKCDRKK